MYSAYNLTKNHKLAQLIVNGVFTQYQTLKYKKQEQGSDSVNKYSLGKAIENAQNVLLSSNESIPNNNYPLMRKIKSPKTGKNCNIFIVLLESWTPSYKIP
ncbi:hypothetical protein AGMMS49921_10540 [Endomicrobiia bacterium]|nr:hypothetical protein AGMMS49921_10540 [Endomicrobiia bacterium]